MDCVKAPARSVWAEPIERMGSPGVFGSRKNKDNISPAGQFDPAIVNEESVVICAGETDKVALKSDGAVATGPGAASPPVADRIRATAKTTTKTRTSTKIKPRATYNQVGTMGGPGGGEGYISGGNVARE